MRRTLAACCAALLSAASAQHAAAEIVTRTVEYTHGDTKLIGYLAYDDAVQGKRPGVLVVHEWYGLNDYAKRRARELAALGYVALAADIYGEGKVAANREEAAALAGRFRGGDGSLLRERTAAGLEALRSQEEVDPQRLAAIGYCFGGTAVLELARSGADLDLVVSFHGGLQTAAPASRGDIKATVLVLNGAADPMVPPEDRAAFMKEMDEAGADWQLVEYGGAVHAFTNPDADKAGIPGVAYDEKADRRSWEAMRSALAEAFAR
jgi:dienelactone hydrolase